MNFQRRKKFYENTDWEKNLQPFTADKVRLRRGYENYERWKKPFQVHIGNNINYKYRVRTIN